MKDTMQGMVLASFAADALALGVHWIYNTRVIDRKYGRLEHFVEPLTSYHETKGLGEFTHYGDQMLALLEAVATKGVFELDHFADRWRNLFNGYDGYLDQATKRTLANFEQGLGPEQAGSDSSDLAGAARIAPLAYCYRNDLEGLVAAARRQTAMTHNQSEVIDSAEFIARLTAGVLQGQPPKEALSQISQAHFTDSPINEWVTAGLHSAEQETRPAIAEFGQMCEVAAALPSAVHLIARHEASLKEALVENILAGGDSAARGMTVGMVLGAYHGTEAIPANWLSELKARPTIERLLAQIDGLRA